MALNFNPMLDAEGGINYESNQANHKKERNLDSETSFQINDRYLNKKLNDDGISNFEAFLSILKRQVGFTILLMPIGLKELGLGGYMLAIVFIFFINMYSIWLQSKSERWFISETTPINSLGALVNSCFNKNVYSLYSLVRMLSSAVFLIAFNMYLGAETDQILCSTVKNYTCGKYDLLIREAFNLMMLPIVFTGNNLIAQRLLLFMTLISFLIAIGFVMFHEWMVVREEFLQ